MHLLFILSCRFLRGPENDYLDIFHQIRPSLVRPPLYPLILRELVFVSAYAKFPTIRANARASAIGNTRLILLFLPYVWCVLPQALLLELLLCSPHIKQKACQHHLPLPAKYQSTIDITGFSGHACISAKARTTESPNAKWYIGSNGEKNNDPFCLVPKKGDFQAFFSRYSRKYQPFLLQLQSDSNVVSL